MSNSVAKTPVDFELERAAFEAWVSQAFVCGEHAFVRAHGHGYINTVQSQTFNGRVQPQYASMQMLWETWRASHKAAASGVREGGDA